jgi:putative aldouronate transport system substrate-binding protein
MILKKAVIVAVIPALMASLAACSTSGGTNKGNDVSVSKPAAPTGPVTIRVLFTMPTSFPDKNAVLDEIRKKTGVNVEFIVATDGATMEPKLNAMIASNDLPDIILSSSKVKMKEFVDNKLIIPLDDLLNKSGKNILENKGKYLKGSGYFDGKIYGIPRSQGSEKVLAVRKDWLDKLNLKVPTTTDEYYNVLKAFVNNDPDGNGQKDTIGLGIVYKARNVEHIFGAFGVPLGRGKLVDGKVQPWVLQPGFLDAIKYMNKLYKEGLIEPEFATVPDMQEFEKLWNGKMGAFEWTPTGLSTNWLSRYKDPKTELAYTIIKGPKGEGGSVRFVREDSGPWVHITKGSKYPEEAMKLMDFLASEEGDRLTWAGIEGVQYTMKDGKFAWIAPFEDAAKLRNEGGYVYNGLMSRVDGLQIKLLSPQTQAAMKLTESNPLPDTYLFEVPEIEQEMGKVMNDLADEIVVKLIISKGDLDKEYDQLKKNYLDAGGQKWIEQATAIYNKEKAKK